MQKAPYQAKATIYLTPKLYQAFNSELLENLNYGIHRCGGIQLSFVVCVDHFAKWVALNLTLSTSRRACGQYHLRIDKI